MTLGTRFGRRLTLRLPLAWLLAIVAVNAGAVGCGSRASQASPEVLTCHAEPTRSGQGGWYVNAPGSCEFQSDELLYTALNPVDFANGAACGACLRVQGPLGETTVRVTDLCPNCSAGGMETSPTAFAQIATPSQGVAPITWRYVPCDVVGPIQYHFREWTNQYSTAVQVRNARNAVAKLEYLAGGAYHEVARTSNDSFHLSMGYSPFTFRVTDVYGHVLEDENVPATAGGTVDGAGQFPVCEGQ